MNKMKRIMRYVLALTQLMFWSSAGATEAFNEDGGNYPASVLIHAVAPGEHPSDNDSPYRLSNAMVNVLLSTDLNESLRLGAFLNDLSARMKKGERGPHITMNNIDFNQSLCPDEGILKALMVGVDDYLHFPKLKYPTGEAKRIAKALSTLCGKSEIVLLLDQQASKQKINDVLRSFQATIKPEDNVVIHFSGHGIYMNKDYIALADIEDVDSNCIRLDDFYDVENALDYIREANLSLVFLDASRSAYGLNQCN